MKRNLLVVTISFLFLCSLGGCGVMHHYVVSQPAMVKESFFVSHYDHKINLKDITLNIMPRNDINTFSYFLIWPFIPIYFDSEDYPLYQEPPFKIQVAMQPHVEGFTLNPREIVLKVEGKEIPISRVNGPIVDNIVYAETDKWLEKRVNKGHVVCSAETPEPLGDAHPDIMISLTDVGMWHCYDLLFETQVPSPDQHISLILSGLFYNGVPYHVQDIEFKKTKWTRGGAAP